MERQTLNKVDMFMELTGLNDENIMHLLCLGLSRFIHVAKELDDEEHLLEVYNHLQIANTLLEPEHRPELPAMEDL